MATHYTLLNIKTIFQLVTCFDLPKPTFNAFQRQFSSAVDLGTDLKVVLLYFFFVCCFSPITQNNNYLLLVIVIVFRPFWRRISKLFHHFVPLKWKKVQETRENCVLCVPIGSYEKKCKSSDTFCLKVKIKNDLNIYLQVYNFIHNIYDFFRREKARK